MPAEIEKVVCHVIHDGHLLVSTHHSVPLITTGVQAPAGTIEDGETPEQAAERELFEETGQRGRVVQPLGVERYDLRPSRDQITLRRFFLMTAESSPLTVRLVRRRPGSPREDLTWRFHVR
ncbi:NUDIX domain-containing protein [Curtobacterium sp. A7_M15]|uniref:NUDIX domain-containing protein n=1 Tax=Curtobacterium sp. A7_M15 TaxID=3065241 RepID=UPI00273796D2|nr:NUDIX domain-containing protein [Curtobacterium sp. A7_M15]MDP4332085.1 NUDIX domain-containing protein [Curtobacterium sp. A7_M15]